MDCVVDAERYSIDAPEMGREVGSRTVPRIVRDCCAAATMANNRISAMVERRVFTIRKSIVSESSFGEPAP